MCGARLSKAWQKLCSEADSAVPMEIVPLGDSALIVRVDDSLGEVLATMRKLEAANISGVSDIAPAFASVALFLESPENSSRPQRGDSCCLAEKNDALPRAAAKPRLIEVPVCYDVEFALDLETVAQHCGLSPNEVVARHAAARYWRALRRVYTWVSISGRPAREARHTAAEVTAPRRSRRIGRDRRPADRHLSAPFARRLEHYRADATSAFRCDTGTGRALPRGRPGALFPNRAGRVREMGKIGVVRAGPLTSVQDLGRPGYRALGVSRGGALDLRAAQIANLLVGNPTEAGLLEITLGAVQLRFADARRVAWCGGEFTVQIAGTNVPAGRPAFVRPGEVLKVGASPCGCRAWLAIGGGVEVPAVLGSRSTDLRSGFGGYKGRALQDGDELSLGKATTLAPETAKSRPGAPHRDGR